MPLGPWKKIHPAGEYLGVKERKVRAWVASGKLKHVRVDGVLYFATEWLDEFMLCQGTVDQTKEEKIDKIVDEVMKGLQ